MPDADKPLPQADAHLEGWKPRTTRPAAPTRSGAELVNTLAPVKKPPNPFTALEEAHKAVVDAHRILTELSERLIVDTPAFEAPGSPSHQGLFGLAVTSANEIRDRAGHIRGIVERLGEHLA